MESLHYYLNYDVSEIIAKYCNCKTRKINLINRRLPSNISGIIYDYAKHSLDTILNFGTSTCKYNGNEFAGAQNDIMDIFVPTLYDDFTKYNPNNVRHYFDNPIKLGIMQNENDFSFRYLCDYNTCFENIEILAHHIIENNTEFHFVLNRDNNIINGITINITNTNDHLGEIIEYISFEIGGAEYDKIYGYDLRLLLKLYGYKLKRNNNSISFQLPFHLFKNYLPLIIVRFHEFRIICKLRSPCEINSCSLIINKSYKITEQYRNNEMLQNFPFELITLLQGTQINTILKFPYKPHISLQLNHPISFMYFYFVGDEKIIYDKILESYELCFQNSSKINMKTNFLSKEIDCYKWKQYYIIPVSKGSPLKQIVPTGTLNLSRINELTIKFNFTKLIENYKYVRLHTKTIHFNFARMLSGMMGLAFSN